MYFPVSSDPEQTEGYFSFLYSNLKLLSKRQIIYNILFYCILFFIPLSGIMQECMDLIDDPDRHWNTILEGQPFGPGREPGPFGVHSGVHDKFFGNKKLVFSRDLHFLRTDLRRNTVTKDFMHGFNISVLIVTIGMVMFYEFHMLCSLRKFVVHKKFYLMIAAASFFIISILPAIIMLILIPNKNFDLDGHRTLYDNALKDLAKMFRSKLGDEDYIGDGVSLSPESWLRIILQCRLAEGDQETLTVAELLVKSGLNTKLDTDLINDLVIRQKEYVPFLVIGDKFNKSYDITWLRDLKLCPLDPGDYMIDQMVDIFFLCIDPLIFFAVKTAKLYKRIKKANREKRRLTEFVNYDIEQSKERRGSDSPSPPEDEDHEDTGEPEHHHEEAEDHRETEDPDNHETPQENHEEDPQKVDSLTSV